jgi:predicted DNA-binding ribbon-helix-helix protein
MSAADRDPGPLARIESVKADPTTMDVIVQRLADGEHPESLKDIARAWKVPYTNLAAWIIEDRERADRYSAALRFAAETFVHQAVPIADGAKPERDEVAKAKLQIEARKWVASKWDRSKYGESTEVKHTGAVSLVAVLSGLRGRELDVTPSADSPQPEATGALPAPVAVEQNVPEKISTLETI